MPHKLNCCCGEEAVDTNFGNFNLTFIGDRLHTAGMFGFAIEGLTAGGVAWSFGVSNTGELQFTTNLGADTVTELITPTTRSITAVDGISTGIVSIEPDLIEISSTDGGDTAQLQVQPGSISLNHTSGVINVGDGAGGNLPATSPATWDVGLDANGKMVKRASSNDVEHFGINIDEGAVVSTGYKGRLIVPYAGTITGWTILETSETPITGDIVVDVLLGTYANYDTTPTFASIAGTEKPTISANVKGQDLSLSTWTTAVAAGDILQFSVDSAATVEKVYVSVLIQRT